MRHELLPRSSSNRLAQFDYDTVPLLLGGKSKDQRVPDLTVEGWKLSVADTSIRLRSNRDTSFSSSSAHGLSLRLDYVRSTEKRLPNVLGMEFSEVPGIERLLAGSIGYMLPATVVPLSVTLRARLAHRTNYGVGVAARQGQTDTELTLVTDFTYEIYPPAALYFQFDIAGYDYGAKREVLSGKKGSRVAIGIRFDLAGFR